MAVQAPVGFCHSPSWQTDCTLPVKPGSQDTVQTLPLGVEPKQDQSSALGMVSSGLDMQAVRGGGGR